MYEIGVVVTLQPNQNNVAESLQIRISTVHNLRLQYGPYTQEKRSVVSNKNITVGSAILEISKILMLEFSYNVFKLQWLGDGQVQVYYRDTD